MQDGIAGTRLLTGSVIQHSGMSKISRDICTCCEIPYSLYNAHPIAHPPEDGMLAIQPGRHSECDEELHTHADCVNN